MMFLPEWGKLFTNWPAHFLSAVMLLLLTGSSLLVTAGAHPCGWPWSKGLCADTLSNALNDCYHL